MACQPLLSDFWFPRYGKLKIWDLALRYRMIWVPWGARVGEGIDIYTNRHVVSRKDLSFGKKYILVLPVNISVKIKSQWEAQWRIEDVYKLF